MSAPASIRARTTAVCPSAAAHIRAVWPSRSRASVLRAAREQRLHRLDIPGARSQHQDGFPAFHRGVRVGSGLQQQLHNCSVAVRTCRRQRRHAIAIHGVHIGARLHEQCGSLSIIVIRGPVQRGGPIDLGGVYVDACPEELADAGLVAVVPRRRRARRATPRRLGRRGRPPAVRVHLFFASACASPSRRQFARTGLRFFRCCPRTNPDERRRDRAA